MAIARLAGKEVRRRCKASGNKLPNMLKMALGGPQFNSLFALLKRLTLLQAWSDNCRNLLYLLANTTFSGVSRLLAIMVPSIKAAGDDDGRASQRPMVGDVAEDERPQ